ncbi:metal-dependent hydrolase (plasmid) [Fulvitalea axinellae]|uniref:Metal-dependent hydrolase n=1 Tax=Fulvitalea axinellae TaxID=1182444 RepID=A0AAU9DHQ0_9BACT|nr:metal-dependent hydrolase [Fulvitalea axinellae]
MKLVSIVSGVLLCVILVVSCSTSEKANDVAPTNEAYSGPVIDMHVHTGEIMGAISEVLDGPTPPGSSLSFEEHRLQTYKMFEKYNIVKAVVSGVDFRASEWSAIDPKRIIPGTMVLTTERPSVEQCRQAYQEGKLKLLGEVGFYYQGVYANDTEVKPYFDLAEELNIPVSYHLMDNLHNGHANPAQFNEVLRAHPDLKIYVSHAGHPHLEEIKTLLSNFPNLYVDISALNHYEDFEPYIKDLMDNGFGKRIMYGTDQMENPATFDEAFPAIDNLPFLSAEQKADIFYHNAARFLGLSEQEIKKHWGR